MSLASVVVLAAISSSASAQEQLALAAPNGAGAGSAVAAAALEADLSPEREEAVSAVVAAAARPFRKPYRGASAELERLLQMHSDHSLRTNAKRAHDQRLLSVVSRLNAPVRLGPVAPTDSLHGFLREDLTYAVVRYQGFDRIALRELGRTYKRLYQRQIEERYESWSYESSSRHLDDLYEAQRQAKENPTVKNRFAMPFPMYWTGHPDAQTPPVTVHGERITVLRFGPYRLSNEGRVRYHSRTVFFEVLPETQDTAETRSDRNIHQSIVRRRTIAPRGSLYENDNLDVNAVGHLSLSRARVRISGKVEVRLYDDTYNERLLAMQVGVDYEPQRNVTQVAVMFKLRAF